MGKHRNILKTLRAIALEHATASSPDLALLARELGRVVHQETQSLNDRLAPLRTREHGFERWLLARRRQPSIGVLVMAWPPNHLTPIHDHAGVWGLDIALHGALEVQSYARDPISAELRMQGRDWLGPGDGSWFDTEQQHARRCRNLSRHETALSLHVYGGDLAKYFVGGQTETVAPWSARPLRSALANRPLR